MRSAPPVILLCVVMLCGCGTSRWTDTKRTATEQLLISDAMDRAVSRLDFCALAGKTVYLDATYIEGALDAAYLISSLRQHMLASGCILLEKRDQADYIAEVRAGAIGTDRRELLFGVPATKIPEVIPVPGVPASIPELPLAKKTEQRGVAKIAVFAYNRRTGRPVWQSGAVPIESTAKDIWVLGAGPFQRGTIYEGTSFAGDKIGIPLVDPREEDDDSLGEVSVANPAFFTEPIELLAERASPKPPKPAESEVATEKAPRGGGQGVVPAGYAEPILLAPEPLARPPLDVDPPFELALPPSLEFAPLPPAAD